MAWKHHSELTLDECEQEVFSLNGYFEDCHAIQQGINTKEVVRYRACVERLREAGRYVEVSPYVNV